jgi:hypothetical protein
MRSSLTLPINERTHRIALALVCAAVGLASGALAVVVNPLFVLPLIPLAAGAVWATRTPERALWLLVAGIALLPRVASPVSIGFKPTVIDAALLLLLAAWVIGRTRRRAKASGPAFPGRVGYPLAALVFVAVAAFIAGIPNGPLTTLVLRRFGELILTLLSVYVMTGIFAAPGARQEAYGNPLAVRAPLAAGVTVIVAHAASLGHAHDTDRPSAPKVPAFDLWARVMDENRGSPRLLADLSAVFQRNRRPTVWRRILEREDWHAQLLHGSDHPLPGVMPLTSLDKLVAAGLLAAADAPVLQRVRAHNPLLADFVLKRRLALGSVRLPPSVFEGVALARLRAASSAAGRDAAATTNPTTT